MSIEVLKRKLLESEELTADEIQYLLLLIEKEKYRLSDLILGVKNGH